VGTGGVLLLSSDFDERALVSAALEASAVRVLELALDDELDAAIEREGLEVAVVIEQLREDPVLDWIVRALARHPQLHVVVFFDSDQPDARRTQIDGDVRSVVLPKPIDAAQLVYHVRAMLEREPAAGALEAAPSAHVQQRMQELQREFARELPSRLQKIAAALGEARQHAAAAEEVAALAHRLRGSAAAYGFAALGQAAGVLEDVLARRAGAELSRGDLAQLELALSDMIASAQTAPRSLTGLAPARSYLGLAPLLVLDDDAEFVRRVRLGARSQFLDSILAHHPRGALEHARRTPLAGVLLGARFEREFRGLGAKLRKVSGRPELPLLFAAQGLAPLPALAELPGALLIDRGASQLELGELLRELAFGRAGERQRVLLVGEDETFARKAREALAELGVELRQLARGEAPLTALTEHAPDLVLLELAEPAALELCCALRRSLRHRRLSVMLAVERDDAALRLSAYQAGACDVLPKSLCAQELSARAAVRLEQARLLREQAQRDPLTGLLTLRPFLEAGERALSRTRRTLDPLAVAFLDIDGLERVNREHGHAVGDDVIAQLGRLLQARFRASDVRCRWAGGQFALLFDGADKRDLRPTLERLLADFAACAFAAARAELFHAGASAGLAAFPEDGESLHALLTFADQRLCAAKQAGGGQLCSEEARAPAEAT
jgi:diguanylate cyclase (GGDEF)-like protein